MNTQLHLIAKQHTGGELPEPTTLKKNFHDNTKAISHDIQ